MKKIFVTFIIFVLVLSKNLIGQGIWMPNHLHKREADMQSRGLKISAEDIYSETQPSFRNAVVRLSTGCSGGFISSEGLLLTNHHCGERQLQMLSTVENDILRNGFWAMSRSEEILAPDLSVIMTEKIVNVTDAVNSGIEVGMSEQEAEIIRRTNIAEIVAKEENNADGFGYSAEVRAFFGGNEFYLFLFRTFYDVRLVGAPPANIGRFGGVYDNWSWPRHAGDFMLFRVYVDENNQPAKFCETNVPYQPQKYFSMSLSGAQKNDFTWIYGFPGRTTYYISSFALRQVMEIEHPIAIAARYKRKNIMRAAMAEDPKIRIQYTTKVARISNAWKRWSSEIRGVNRINGIAKKEAFEKEFQQWADTFNNGEHKYLLHQLQAAHGELEPFLILNTVFNEHVLAPEIVAFANQFNRLVNLSNERSTTNAIFNEELNRLKQRAETFFRDFNADIDRELFKTLSVLNIDGLEMRFVDFPDLDFDEYVNEMYATSIFTNEARFNSVFRRINRRNAARLLGRDPILNYAQSVFSMFNSMIAPEFRELRSNADVLQRTFMRAQIEMQPDKMFWPDANSTLRVAYGQVHGFSPSDAVTYRFYTTLGGLIAKENPDIYEFTVKDRLRELYHNRDFGRYANENGEIVVNFISSNHTISGNSGSPILNGRGELIGLNYSRVWQAAMAGYFWDPEQSRNTSVDSRYILFIIDKFGGAGYLLDEMTIVE
ncbi:MAG: S46 family peptidase [Bacteroidales bacterium]|nr:S46 family peptidase [Bacteroidales bacterium]